MIGLETVNLYSGFVGLSLALMEDGGELRDEKTVTVMQNYTVWIVPAAPNS